MAGKLVFKLTGGKTDKDEEYESLKDEFLKYKKVVPLRCSGMLICPRGVRGSEESLWQAL